MDTDKLRTVLGQRIKERNFSQRSASLAAGLHPNTLNNIMQLRRVPDPETLRKLATLLELDEDDLMELAGHRSPALNDAEVPPKLRTWFHTLYADGIRLSARSQDLIAYILRQEYDAAGRPHLEVIAAAGDPSDLELPENQRLLDQLENDE